MTYTLFRHQEEALARSKDQPGFLYAHEMGLGKTCTTLADALRNNVQFLFVVAPVGVAQAWVVDHAPKYAPGYFKTSVYLQSGKLYYADGSLCRDELEAPLLLSVNFESLRGKGYSAFRNISKNAGDEGMLVVDESHRIKNPQAQVTKAVLQLAPYFKHKRALTGTPIGNGHQDLYTQLKFVAGPAFPHKTFRSYALDFCNFGGYKNKQITGDRNPDKLREIMAPYVHIAKKEECLDLPPKIYKKLYLDFPPATKRLYKQAKNKILETDSGKDLTVAINAMNTMRNITSGFVEDRYLYDTFDDNPKIKALKGILEDHRRDKCVIFVSYIKEGKMLSEALGVPFYSGASNHASRDVMLESFKTNKTQHLIATIQTLGTGHDLHMANIEVFFSNDYSYLLRTQAEDRCHRIGQTSSVIVYDLLITNTIDTKILRVLEQKGDVAKVILKTGLAHFI